MRGQNRARRYGQKFSIDPVYTVSGSCLLPETRLCPFGIASTGFLSTRRQRVRQAQLETNLHQLIVELPPAIFCAHYILLLIQSVHIGDRECWTFHYNNYPSSVKTLPSYLSFCIYLMLTSPICNSHLGIFHLLMIIFSVFFFLVFFFCYCLGDPVVFFLCQPSTVSFVYLILLRLHTLIPRYYMINIYIYKIIIIQALLLY